MGGGGAGWGGIVPELSPRAKSFRLKVRNTLNFKRTGHRGISKVLKVFRGLGFPILNRSLPFPSRSEAGGKKRTPKR